VKSCEEKRNQAARAFEQIIGNSPALESVLEQVERVAPTDSTVLIQGETGTGKEVIARKVHDRSERRNRPFVAINCAAIPATLLESELFGHERGAFTGASISRPGRFETAHKGTLFLDEIGELPLELQPKLLRAIQEQEFERLGSNQTVRVDVRIVAATNPYLSITDAERSAYVPEPLACGHVPTAYAYEAHSLLAEHAPKREPTPKTSPLKVSAS